MDFLFFCSLNLFSVFYLFFLFLAKTYASWPKGFGYLADQIMRAMASVALNVAEGNAKRSSKAERRRFFETARASAAEVGACLDLMRSFRLIGQENAEIFKSEIIEISKMLWSLMR